MEHVASIKKHFADYLAERKERIEDAEGGHLDTREAAAAGPDDRKARSANVAAATAALESGMGEAEKFGDREHEASLKKHLMDYLSMEHGLGRDRQNIADREGPRAEYEALLGQLKEAEKFHDVEHDEMRDQRAATCHMPLSTANDLKHEAGCRSGFSYGQWSMVYNACSFGIASMASAMTFVWLMLLGNQVHKKFKPALGINGLVTGIAAYHYFRIFNSWCDSFDVFY